MILVPDAAQCDIYNNNCFVVKVGGVSNGVNIVDLGCMFVSYYIKWAQKSYLRVVMFV